ncbi:hypothetical protein HBA55_26695 [Pseudomaricurvus alkylphenolicus]|jgi:hypothetical protein|uniref:hypothetical protein n=1 Tax=Pseudomaricurvus alkylphenolicus TaxID=1306991 RepID=UPI00141F6E3C|nr:hypothetical protein [Pseudomaricurvus alkylphenolicus]NIB43225.1 hypothetical protein [Pseudomaricurvus alkylphenolicus]
MAVVPYSQLTLCRERKSLQDAYLKADWQRVKDLDSSLMQAVDQASEDPGKDMAALLQELQEVVGLYRDMLDQCDTLVRDAADHLL